MDIEKIYKLYFKDVYRYLYSISKNASLAEDITQDCFFKALKNIDKYDGSKDIRAWLFTIAKNTFYTHYKRESIYCSYEEVEEKAEESNYLETMIEKDTVADIEKIIDKMDEPFIRISEARFVMYCLENVPEMESGQYTLQYYDSNNDINQYKWFEIK